MVVSDRGVRLPVQEAATSVPKLDLFCLHLFLAGDLIVVSRFYEFAGFFVRSPLFYMTVACLPLFFVRAVQKSYFPELGVFLLAALGMVVQILHFSQTARQAPNFNSVAQYYTMFSFIVFANFLRRDDVERLLRTIYFYTAAYVVIYVAASLAITFHVMPPGLEERLTQTDQERGARILIVASSTLYCMYYSYFKAMERRQVAYAAMFVLALAALLISQSRLLIVIVACVSLASLVLPGRAGLSVFCFAAFAALSGVVLYGMVDSHWNPFVVFGDDSSARIRTEGYETVRRILTAHPILGAGIAADDAGMVAFTANPTLSAADLGPIGIWFVFGLPGLVLYVISVYGQCFCTRFGGCGSIANSKAVQYTGCLIGLFGCLTPTWFNGSVVGLFIALCLRQGGIRREAADYGIMPTATHAAERTQFSDDRASHSLGWAG